MSERTNEQWMTALKQHGPERDAALAELRALLVRGLGYALSGYTDVSEAHLEDFAQDALLKILDALDTFRGESRFTTWAHKIAVRVAFTELRRHRWRDTSLDEMRDLFASDFTPRALTDPSAGPERQAMQSSLVAILQQVISQELTERQRQALLAVRVHGMPLEEVARRMGTNRNALYKLLHDARRRLKQRLLERGLTPDEVLTAFES